MSEAINHIDNAAFLKQSGTPYTLEMKKLKQVTSVLASLEGESLELYYSIAIELLTSIQYPKKIFQRKQYSGASKRVKQKLEGKHQQEVKELQASLGVDGTE